MRAQPIRVFWQPGCSSCVKVKEFLAGLGVPFESVNVLEDNAAFEELAKFGARTVPVVARGGDFIFAQSLAQVAAFVGRDASLAESLPPETLMKRWTYFLEIGESLIAEIPPDRLEHRPVPNRNRSLRSLAYHVYQIPDSFLETVAGHIEDWAYFANLPPPEDVRTNADVLSYAAEVTARLKAWWTGLEDKSCRWPVKTFYGVRPTTELLERQTWHSAQHVRQLQAVLEGFGVPLARKIDSGAYSGLPMPAGLWE